MAETYTYIDFGNDAVTLANGGEIADTAKFKEKALKFLDAQHNKKEYSATHPKKTAAKGASDATKALAGRIVAVLGNEPMTSADINEALGDALNPLQIANAIKYSGVEVKSEKVIREVRDLKGLKAEKRYTAYSLG